MPSVPYSPVPDVAAQDIPSPFLRVQADPNAFGAGIARAVQGLGSTIEKSGGELFDRAVAMQQLRNETEATEAAANYVGKSSDMVVNFESTKRGLNAVAGEADHRKAQQDLWDQSRSELSNPMAQKMFDAKTLSNLRNIQTRGAWHAAAENRTALSNAYQTQVQSAVDRAGNARSLEELNPLLGEIDSTSNDFGVANGIAKESVDQLAFKDKSAARARYIEGLNRKDPVAARQLMDQWIDQGLFHGNDRDRIEGKIHGQLMSTGASHFVEGNDQDFRNPEGFLGAHGPKGLKVEGLDQRFGQSMVAAFTAYKAETGKDPTFLGPRSLVRSTQDQIDIRRENEAKPGGVAAHPAALPGMSRHERGAAADTDPAFAEWLRQGNNGKRFGLETGASFNDPNHVQLAGDTPMRKAKQEDISERNYVNGALARLDTAYPNAPAELKSHTEQLAIAKYRRNVDLDRQEEQTRKDTILEAFDSDNPPRSIQELLTKDPKYQDAWVDLDQKDQDAFIRRMATHKTTTDNNEWARLRGMAMSQDEDERQKFLKEDIIHNDKLSPGHQREIMRLQDTVRKQAFIEPRVAHAEAELLDAGIITVEERKNNNLMARLRGTLWDRIDQYQKVREAYPKPEEIRQMGARIMAEQTTPVDARFRGYNVGLTGFALRRMGFFGSSGRLIDVTVPSQASDEIIDQWSSSHGGIPPTDEQVKRIYIGQKLKELYPISKSGSK